MKILQHIGIVALSFLCMIGYGAETIMIKDRLIYSTVSEAITVWKPALGDRYAELLKVTETGLVLTGLQGDTYKDTNSQEAVFLRSPQAVKHYYFQAVVDNFIPTARYAQAGIVAWNDEDNYVRNMMGFNPAGREGLGEFNGTPYSQGLFMLFPNTNPIRTILRIEVLERSIRTYASYDASNWILQGGFTLPEGKSVDSFIKGIGIIGVGGEYQQPPVFLDWEEGSLPKYKDDDFQEACLHESWMVGTTNPGWGIKDMNIAQHNGKLIIKPFSGSDIFLGNENYPCVMMPAPQGDTWNLEIKIVSYTPTTKGHWSKAGVLLWQDNQHFLALSLVTDIEGNKIYFEALSYGDMNEIFGAFNIEGLNSLKQTDAYLRFQKISDDAFRLRTSYDRKTWYELGTYKNQLCEPQLRLFATGDIYRQFPDSYDFAAEFDYVKLIKNED